MELLIGLICQSLLLAVVIRDFPAPVLESLRPGSVPVPVPALSLAISWLMPIVFIATFGRNRKRKRWKRANSNANLTPRRGWQKKKTENNTEEETFNFWKLSRKLKIKTRSGQKSRNWVNASIENGNGNWNWMQLSGETTAVDWLSNRPIGDYLTTCITYA